MRIQGCSNEGPRRYPGVIKTKSRKYIDEFKHLLSRTNWIISTKRCTKYSWVKGIQFCCSKGRNKGKSEKLKKSFSQEHLVQHHLTWHKA